MDRYRGGWRLVSAVILVLAAGCREAPPPTAEIQEPRLTLDGTALVLTMPDGTMLRGEQLTGATVHLAIEERVMMPVRLESIRADPEDAAILRYDFQLPDGQGGWKPACEPNAYGERWGFPIALNEGHPGREGDITMTCASGAVGKCVRFGYKPWASADMDSLHAACVRMVRADYCGDGKGHTKNGTEIDIYDDFSIQTSDGATDTGFVFEAGWSPEGAVCVDHVRWADQGSLDERKAECPRLAAITACNEDSARKAGARLFNRSRIQ